MSLFIFKKCIISSLIKLVSCTEESGHVRKGQRNDKKKIELLYIFVTLVNDFNKTNHLFVN